MLINPYVFSNNDPYFASVVLLLKGNGTNGSTAIIDSSASAKTATLIGNTQISTAQSKFGGASIAFDGSGDYMTFPSQSDWDFGSGDWTIEAWVYTTSASGVRPIATRRLSSGQFSPFQIALNGLTAQFRSSSNSASWDIADNVSFGTLTQNAWNYVAVNRVGSQITGAVNSSTSNIATTSASLMTSSRVLCIGGNAEGASFSLPGYIDEMRITKGVGRGLTMPTIPFPSQ